jgi:signal transduction histidine kinase
MGAGLHSVCDRDMTPVPRAPRPLELAVEQIIVGRGEMAERMRAFDWASSPLGAPGTWPQSLRSALSILLASRAQIILFWGPELVALYNDAYVPVFGAKHPWALGRPARECWSEVWDNRLKPLFGGVIETGEAFFAEDLPFMVSRHGFVEETYFDVSYDPVRVEDGSVGGIFCIVTETTGRVLGERRLRMLGELSRRTIDAPDVDAVWRAAADVLSGNAADLPFALLYRLDAAGARATLAACAATTAADVPVTELAVADDALIASVVQQREIVSLRAEHVVTWASAPCDRALVLPLLAGTETAGLLVAGVSRHLALGDAYRAFFGLVASGISTALASASARESERRRAEALAELDRAKSTFFSNVSHEFRTPLTLMLAPIEEALAAPGLPASDRERLALVHRNGLRLQRLVNSLLDFARLEAGRVQASYELVDLAPYTADVASAFRSAVERAGLTLTVDCRSLTQPFPVDREMWEKIVLNLVSNAFKFTFEGGIAVRLRETASRVTLEVEDTGVGIPAHEIPHLFERFHRVQGTRSRSHEGTGIGLALVHELVRLHGGTVQVRSAPGLDSTFSVVLPRGAVHATSAPPSPWRAPGAGAAPFVQEALRWLPGAPPELPRPPEPSTLPTAGARVLIADDNADMREYLARVLGRHWVVETAADGQAALEAVRARPPDLVLSDVMMPRLDGFALLRTLRDDPRTSTVPVILLSARAGEESREEGLGIGADDYLVKPFTRRELVARVNAHLGVARARALAAETREALLRAGREEAMAANRAKDEFLAMLAHELRNPLGVVMNALNGLDRIGSEAAEAVRLRDLMHRQTRHLARLLDDLLDVARITQGKIELRSEIVDLRALVDLAVQSERPRVDFKRQRLEVSVPEQPVTVHGDATRLQQIVANLLNNASKYTPEGGAIALRLAREGDQAVLALRDTGCGIPRERLQTVFDLFVQLDSGLERAEGGLGIGLTLVKRLVEQHGGTVDARSDGTGRGSEFVVRLPSVAPTPAPRAAAVAPAKRVRSILLIEDNDDAREALQLGLELEGQRVLAAADGETGIAIALRERPDVVFLDVGLPGVDGYEVARRLRAKLGAGPVLVALTGYGQAADRARSREAGFDVHVTKPASVADVLRALPDGR